MLFSVILLSIVEGITEFLPISSTGHLILISHYLNMDKDFYEVFDIAIQVGAICAVISLYPHYFKSLIKNPKEIKTIVVLVAIIPILIVGFLIKDIIKGILFNPLFIFTGLMVGGIGLIVVDRLIPLKPIQTDTKENVSIRQALVIGLWQCLALWPGMSRSAVTIIGGMIAGFNRVTSASFSFVIAVPLMIIIVGYDLLASFGTLELVEFGWIFLGILCSYLVSLLTMKWFLGFVRKQGLMIFGIYRIIISIIGIALTYDIFTI